MVNSSRPRSTESPRRAPRPCHRTAGGATPSLPRRRGRAGCTRTPAPASISSATCTAGSSGSSTSSRAASRGAMIARCSSRATSGCRSSRAIRWRATGGGRGRLYGGVFRGSHEWLPFFSGDPMAGDGGEGLGLEGGVEIGYRVYSINGKALGHGDPVRVKRGERVLFRILNASATENIELALPGHEFLVVALDGNPVPAPHAVRLLSLGAAERVDAVVEMNTPGVWILGTPNDAKRRGGLGVVVEYAGATGPPQWIAPAPARWDYTLFGTRGPHAAPDETIPMVFQIMAAGHGHVDRWTINGATFEESAPISIRRGRRYRLALQNRGDDAHPLHLHRHQFELVRVQESTGEWKPTAGVLKDTVLVRPNQRMDVDFVADNPGLTLFHCHHQLHMNFGFARLLR